MMLILSLSLSACSSLTKEKDTAEEDQEDKESDKKKKKKKKDKKEDEIEYPFKVCFEDDYSGKLSECEKYEIEGTGERLGIVIVPTEKVEDFRLYRITSYDSGILVDPPVDDSEPHDYNPYVIQELQSIDKISPKKPVRFILYTKEDDLGFVVSYTKDDYPVYYRLMTEIEESPIRIARADFVSFSLGDPLYEDMSNYSFSFSSGAGAWETELRIKEDGSFEGEYYDYNMGETGPGYEENGTKYSCTFTGKLGTPKELDYYYYEAEVLSLEYDHEPGTEEIIDGTNIIYTGAYGLEDTDKIFIYAPMMSTEFLTDEYIDWVRWEFYDGESDELNLPVEMPTYGIFNPEGGYGFYSQSLLENHNVIGNYSPFPGLVNYNHSFESESKAYDFTDEYEGEFGVRNISYYDTVRHDINDRADAEALVNEVVSRISDDARNVYSFTEDEYTLDNAVKIEGSDCIYAVWDSSGAEVSTPAHYQAKIIQIDNFVYAYAMFRYEDSTIVDDEALLNYMSGLMMLWFRDTEELLRFATSADEELADLKIKRAVLAEVTAKTDETGDAVRFEVYEGDVVYPEDKDLMKKYGLTEKDMVNDYSVEFDRKHKVEYPVSEYARFYVNDPYVYNPIWPSSLEGFLADKDNYAMMLYLDDKDNVIFGYQPYFG